MGSLPPSPHEVHEASQEPPVSYGSLCDLANLEQAYARVASETIESDEADVFLGRLSADLQSGTYAPAGCLEPAAGNTTMNEAASMAARDLVVQASLTLQLDSLVARGGSSVHEPENCVKWVAEAIQAGLTRVYAEEVDVCLETLPDKLLVQRLSRRIGDERIIALLKTVLAAYPELDQRTLLIPLLTNLAFDGIDRMFEEAKELAPQDSIPHMECARFGHQIIVLVDPKPQYDWFLPAIKKRLHDELAVLKWESIRRKPRSSIWHSVGR
jgi:hypothetical protein